MIQFLDHDAYYRCGKCKHLFRRGSFDKISPEEETAAVLAERVWKSSIALFCYQCLAMQEETFKKLKKISDSYMKKNDMEISHFPR